MKTYVVHISGNVQGVGFRWFVKRAALACRIQGKAENLQDGRVRITAQGPAEMIEQFLSVCRKGPSGAVIEAMTVEEKELPPYTGFSMK